MFTTVYMIAYIATNIGAGRMRYHSANHFPDKATCEVVLGSINGMLDHRAARRFCVPHVITATVNNQK